MGGLLEDGEDFSNNLASDLAPLLALFGERVTMQFMSQSTGWADCIMLSVAPLGIITILVSAIRVGGYRWLKAMVGRARENIVQVELEVMSSTSRETCELWNGRTVVRCPGTAEICEFICVCPQKTSDIESIRVMDIKQAVSAGVLWCPNEETRNNPKHSAIKIPFGIFQRGLRAILATSFPNRKDMADSSQGRDEEHACSSSIQRRDPTIIQRVLCRNPSETTSENLVATDRIERTKATFPLRKLLSNEMIIIRDRKHPSPNISLNCQSENSRWQLWAFAAFGIVLQSGVLVYFGFATEYHMLKFQKDGQPVEKYAMPLAVTGTFLLVVGMLMCSHVVDRGSKETIYKLMDVNGVGKHSLAIIWLQKQKTVSDQHFESAAIFPTDTNRYSFVTSGRAIEGDDPSTNVHDSRSANSQLQMEDSRPDKIASNAEGRSYPTVIKDVSSGSSYKPSSTWDISGQKPGATNRVQTLTAAGTFISLLGIGGQFTGLRGMHWTASIAQLAAVILMTFLRAIARRHLSQGIKHKTLVIGYELEWFVMSLSHLGTAPSIPPVPKDPTTESMEQHVGKRFCWKLQTEISDSLESLKKAANTSLQDHNFQLHNAADASYLVNNLGTAQSTLNLRRYLGELGNWRSPMFAEALILSRAIEVTMNYFHSRFSDQLKGETFDWTTTAVYDQNSGSQPERVIFHVRLEEGRCQARVEELDAALSLWLFSTESRSLENAPAAFPSVDDSWLRGKKVQHRCLRFLGPQSHGLVRDLKWWMPGGLDGILTAKARPEPLGEGQTQEQYPHEFRNENIGRSGRRWPNLKMDESSMQFMDTTTEPTNSVCNQDVRHLALEKVAWYASFSQEEKEIMPLVIESQQSLEKLYPKELFSSFVWALSTHLQRSSVGKALKAKIKPEKMTSSDGWQNFTLESDELSNLVQRIVNQTGWSENEVYACLIPPLSASDNLPGLDVIIELALLNAAAPEKNRDWYQTRSIYDWIFNTARTFESDTYIYWKSMAALTRFEARTQRQNSRSYQDHYDEYEPYDLRWTRKSVREAIDELDKKACLQQKLDQVFRISESVMPTCLSEFRDELGPPYGMRSDWKGPQRPCYGSNSTRHEERDIFDRTALHHAMRSNHEDRLELLRHDHWEPERRKTRDRIRKVRDLLSLSRNMINKKCVVASDELHWPKICSGALTEPGRTTRDQLEIGADVNARDMDHWTPLHHACDIVLPRLIEDFEDDTTEANRVQSTPCFYQFARGSRRLEGNFAWHLRSIIDERASKKADSLALQNADINAQGLDGISPLHCAVASNCTTLVRWLVQNQANPMIADVDGQTPLHFAAKNNATELFDELATSELHLEAKDVAGRTPLHIAAMYGAAKSIEELVRRGSNRVARDSKGRTPVHMASLYNSPEGIETVLDVEMQQGPLAPMNENIRDDDNRTPLHLAAMFNSTAAVELLLRIGRKANNVDFADIDATDRDGNLALHLAVESNATGAAELFMESMRGRPKHILSPENAYGVTPFGCAVDISTDSGNSVQLVRKFIDQRFGLESDFRDLLVERHGDTAFYRAMSRGQFASAIVLLQAVGNSGMVVEDLPTPTDPPNVKYSRSDLALAIAACAASGHGETVRLKIDVEPDEPPVEDAIDMRYKIRDIVDGYGVIFNKLPENSFAAALAAVSGRKIASMLREGVKRFQPPTP